MRAFRGCVEACKEIERELFEMGINTHPYSMQNKVVTNDIDFETKELIGYSYSLSNFKDIKDLMGFFFSDPEEWMRISNYCETEFEERINNEYVNPGNSWKCRPEVWEKFLNNSGKFDYTYSERMCHQVNKMIDIMRANRDSRQAVLTIYDRHLDEHFIGGKRRIPCSMYYQFILRDLTQTGEQITTNNSSSRKDLTLIYTMRSCDFYTHFPIDMYLALRLLIHVAKILNAKPSKFIHFMGSLHAYRKDYKNRRIF